MNYYSPSLHHHSSQIKGLLPQIQNKVHGITRMIVNLTIFYHIVADSAVLSNMNLRILILLNRVEAGIFQNYIII